MGSKNTFYLWLLAARPKTLTASISPVLIATALAWRDGGFSLPNATICLSLAILFQIASNFINEYIDFRKGSDTTERIGPQRSVSKGLIAPRKMILASCISISVACILGLYLAISINLWLIAVGIVIAIFAYAYSGGPYPMSYNGLGDLCVLIFYGLIPVIFTYYVQTGEMCWESWIAGFAVGIATTNILVANNYRDYEEDRKHHKNTTIVIFGRKFGQIFYLSNGIVAVMLCGFFAIHGNLWATIAPLAFLPIHITNYYSLKRANTTTKLISILGKTSIGVFCFSLLLSLGFLL